MGGRLEIVATPIGNLGDLGERGRRAFEQADLVACEDTRHTGLLLNRLEIKRPLISLHEHNEASRVKTLIDRLRAGETIVLVSDAGYPTVSDPGQRLIHAVIREGLELTVIPGASAVLTALAGSGLPADRFFFGGFLPNRSGQRERELIRAIEAEYTSVYFESPHRIRKTLETLASLAPDRPICIARELTKKFEQFIHGPAAQALETLLAGSSKGEFTLVIAGSKIPKWLR
jgi:16S rRNA (cytidine1402-2'-O)-methyltransferase